MNEVAQLVLAIIGSIIVWTTSIVGGVIWLTGKFRALEKIIYREMDKHRKEDDVHFYAHGTRLQRLEIKAFGFTGGNGGPVVPDSGATFPGDDSER